MTVPQLTPDLESFNQDLINYASLLQTPGMAVGVAEGDQLIYFKGLGYADRESRTTITADTLFWIASVTKAFTAVLLKQLEENGRVSLKDKLSNFPNKHFNPARFSPGMTIEHVISHTSESQPCGTLFMYNGSKYNLVFNVFDALSSGNPEPDIARTFTAVLEEHILIPLGLDHTITRIASDQFEACKQFAVTPYAYDAETGAYVPDTSAFKFKTAYPATGMLSSVNDLVRFSHALSTHELISRTGYAELTAPFYDNQNGVSPYGQGWFSTRFEGTDLHWVYGYGDTDAALLLKTPDRNLTLVMLSNNSMPSASTRIWYGNPLNSVIVASFVKNFILQNGTPRTSIDYSGKLSQVEKELSVVTRSGRSNIYQEEAFAYAMLMQLLPVDLFPDKKRAAGILKIIDRRFPDFINPKKTEMFDLLAQFDDPEILRIGVRLASDYENSGIYHPAKAFHAGRIHEAIGDTENAARCYRAVADTPAFLEQAVKHSAHLVLGRHYMNTNPRLAKRLFEELIQYKNMIGLTDREYSEARSLLERWTAEASGDDDNV